MTLGDGRAEGQAPKATKRKIVPIKNRTIVEHCEPGDVVRLNSGDEFVVTTWLNGGPMGRQLAPGGDFGELVSLCPNDPMIRLRGLR